MGIFDKVTERLLGNVSGEPEKLDGTQDQPQDDQKLAAFVKNKVSEARGQVARISHEGIWLTNIAYLLGFDSIFYDTSSKSFQPINKSNPSLRRNRIHVNKILPTIQNRLARLCKNPPKYDVKPNSSDSEDKDAARLGMQVLNMLWDKERINEKRIDLYMWVQQAGHAYIHVGWDDQKGEPMVNPETNELDYEGDVRIDICSPLEIFPDPMAKTIEDCQWLIRAKVRKLDHFRAHYPEETGGRGHLVKEEEAWLLSAQYELRINSLNVQGPTQSGSVSVMKDSAIELTYYEKRSKKHPNGRMVVVANGVLLDDRDLPVGEFPLVKFDDIKIGGKYYSESIITHLRPVQDQYNRIITMRANWANKLLAGKFIAAKGAGLSAETLNDQSGEVVEFNPVAGAGAPQAMNIPVMPQYAYQEEQSLEKMLYDIAGINEVSRGQLPAAGIPAVGMQFLMEQDDTRIGITTESHEHAWAQVGKLILKYVGEYYKMPRILKVAGKNLEYTVKQFTGDHLRHNYDVCVIRGSTLPGSKTLKRQEILNAFQQGLLGDPQDAKVREQVLSILEYGDVAAMWMDVAIDKAQIEKSIEQIKNGDVPEFHERDNHALHIQEKERFRKEDAFNKLPPHAQEIFEFDIERHIQAIIHLTNPAIQQGKIKAVNAMSDPEGAMAQASGIEPDEATGKTAMMPSVGSIKGAMQGGPQGP